MKFLLILPLLAVFCMPASAQNCPPNIDFEAGDFTNWECFAGTTIVNSAGQNQYNISLTPPQPGRHEIISTASAGLDPYGNFPKLCPYGGTYSVKLGNENSGFQAEGISYTFTIPVSADTFSLTYYYAVVFQDPGHSAVEQPRFFVSAYDIVSGALIDCASYNYIATASIPGFTRSTVNTSVWYKNWTPASLDFSGLAGRTVRLEFKTADCTLGAHFGYAYLDVATGCGGVIAAATTCGATNYTSLNAPYGFQSYTWYNANYSVVLATQQSVTLSPPPPPNTLFHVDMLPYPGFGCRDTADALVIASVVPDTPSAVISYYYCQSQTASPLSATASPNCQLYWYTSATGGVGSTTTPIPSTAVNGTFHYYVSQKLLFGCEGNRKEITVNVTLAPSATFIINAASQCYITNNFTFTGNSTNTFPNATYNWDFGDGNTATGPVATHVYAVYGAYTVRLRVSNSSICFRETQQQVRVITTPVAAFNYTQVICENQTPVVLSENSSIPGGVGSINNWQWSIGANGPVSVQNPPPFLTTGGQLPVSLVVSTLEGCTSVPFSATLQVHYRPSTSFGYSTPLCSNKFILFTNASQLIPQAAPDFINLYSWLIDNSVIYSTPTFSAILTPGTHNIKLQSETNIGCKSIIADSSITINEKPAIGINISDSCAFLPIHFTALSNGLHPAVSWKWDFGNGYYSAPQVINQIYPHEGSFPIKLIGLSAVGCRDTFYRPFNIYENHANAGNDTIVAAGQPVQLNAAGGPTVHYSWSPSFGLNNANLENPVAIVEHDQLYTLNARSIYGCDSYSKIWIKTFEGPELYIPGAFTPNGDGLNDILKVFPIGIKVFYSFAVYNRFGNCMYYSTDYSKGWDGTYKGNKADAGTYIIMAKAMDYRGNEMMHKESVILLR